MRKKFIEIIYNKMKTDKKIFLIVGDLGFNLVEPIYNSYPKNFLNVGIAEQNMAGIAAGIFATLSYALVVWSMQFIEIAYVSGIREVSIVFATIIGMIFLSEKYASKRIIPSILIALGIATVYFQI